MYKSCFFLLVTLLATAKSLTITAQELVFVADEWCPYNCEANSERPGYMVELLVEVFEPAGHKVSYKVMPWSRAVKQTREGDFAGIIGAFKNDAPDFIFPTKPLGLASNDFFAHTASGWRFSGTDSLKGKKVAIIDGYDYGEPLTSWLHDQSLAVQLEVTTGTDALEKNIKKLIRGRVDIIIENKQVVYSSYQDSEQGKQIQWRGSDGANHQVYVAFSPKRDGSAKLAERLAQSLDAFRASGQLDKILQKYGLSDWGVPSKN